MADDEKRKVLDNYIVWKLVSGVRSALSKKYRDAGKGLEKALYGKESHHERWRLCITDTATASPIPGSGCGPRSSAKAGARPQQTTSPLARSAQVASLPALTSTAWATPFTRRGRGS